MIEKEQAKSKTGEIKDILKRKFNQEAKVGKRKLRWKGNYFKVTWSALGRRTFLSVCMRGWLKIHKSPSEHSIPYKDHLNNLASKGFKLAKDTDGLSCVDWNISNPEELVKLQFEYYYPRQAKKH